MKLIDTHAHPHMDNYPLEPEEFLRLARDHGVENIICVGTSAADSRKAVEFAVSHPGCFASVGLHPHDAKLGEDELELLGSLAEAKEVVAVGECGFDYYYLNSPKDSQKTVFDSQLRLAKVLGLPLIFHVRNQTGKASGPDAFDDFFELIDNYPGTRGVVHSFTADTKTMERCLERGLYIGLNGIMTFTKDEKQLAAAKAVPLGSLVLETDAPFLTPEPYRGTINHSGHVQAVAEFLSQLRGESLAELVGSTTENACKLFKL